MNPILGTQINDQDYIEITLPLPPSVNEAYAGTVRRHLSNEYKAWLKEANIVMNKHRKDEISGDEWLMVEYTYYFSLYTDEWEKRNKDVFNYEKCLSDLLNHRLAWFNDHKIRKGYVEKIDSEKSYVVVRIWETI